MIKIFVYFLVVINLYLSFDHFGSQDSIANNYNIELPLIAQNKFDNESIDYNQLKQSFSLCKPVRLYKKNHKFNYQTNNQNALEQIKFRDQKHNILNFKSTLLQIVINEISIQKSHCI